MNAVTLEADLAHAAAASKIISVSHLTDVAQCRQHIYNNHNPVRCGIAASAVSRVSNMSVADMLATAAILIASVMAMELPDSRGVMIAGTVLLVHDMVAQADADAAQVSDGLAVADAAAAGAALDAGLNA